jgi:hypothetical protein
MCRVPIKTTYSATNQTTSNHINNFSGCGNLYNNDNNKWFSCSNNVNSGLYKSASEEFKLKFLKFLSEVHVMESPPPPHEWRTIIANTHFERGEKTVKSTD